MATASTGTTLIRPREPSAEASWQLTELDRANAILVVRGAWLFDRPIDPERLRDGLQRVLVHYPHLAGRPRKGRGVVFAEGGVPFTVASQPGISCADIVAEPALAHRHADRMSALGVQFGWQPLLKVRLTRLRDGTLLTVTCSHAALDGNGFYTFVRNWSWSCSGHPFGAPVLDPSLVPPPLAVSRDELVQQAQAAGWSRLTAGQLLRVVLLTLSGKLGGRCKVLTLSPAQLRRLRTAAARASQQTGLRTFEALSAHLTRMAVRLVGHPAATRCTQVTVLDARRHVATLPAEYAGNAAFAITSAGFTADATLGEIATSIQQGLQPYLATPSERLTHEIALVRALVQQRALYMTYDADAMHAAAPTLIYVNNFWTLPIYDLDFGEPGAALAPVLAIPHDLPDPVLIWPTPPEHGGVEVYFTGRLARAVRRLPADHPWWSELRQWC